MATGPSFTPPSFSKLNSAQLRHLLTLLERAKDRDLAANPLRFVRHPSLGVLPLRLWAKQREFRGLYQRVHKVAGWDGPNRAGKSLAAAVIIVENLIGIPYEQWADLETLPDLPPGPPRHWGCVTIHKEKSREAQQRYIAERIPGHWLACKPWNARTGFGGSGGKLVLRNGSTVDFLSDLQREQSMESYAWHGLWLDEAVDEWVFQRGIARLVDTGGKTMITSVAEKPWIYRVLRQRRLSIESNTPAGPELVDTISDSTMLDNELMNRAEIDRAIELWGGADSREARMRVYGQYVHLEGVVFPEYTEEPGGHLAPAIDCAPADWTKYEGLDPGYAVPFAVLFVGIDKAGVVHWYDEIYVKGKTPAEVAALIKDKRQKHKYAQPARPAVIDSAADQARHWGQTREPWRKQLERAGIVTEPCKKYPGSVDAGEQLLRAYLVDRRLVVHANCEWARYNLQNYRWADTPAAVGEFTGDRERRVDAHNHLIDAGRYVLETNPRYIPPAAQAAPRGSFADDLQRAAAAKAARLKRKW